MHLIIDGYGGDVEKMRNPDFIRRFLEEYPPRIHMTKISPPYVIHYQSPQPQDSGVSGFIFIAESHISVHTFPERAYINIDVFSCKDFDTEAARKEIQEIFSLSQIKSWVLERGLGTAVAKDVETLTVEKG